MVLTVKRFWSEGRADKKNPLGGKILLILDGYYDQTDFVGCN